MHAIRTHMTHRFQIVSYIPLVCNSFICKSSLWKFILTDIECKQVLIKLPVLCWPCKDFRKALSDIYRNCKPIAYNCMRDYVPPASVQMV